jgi:hypothetical protein
VEAAWPTILNWTMTTALTLLKFLLNLGKEIIEKMVERLSSGNLQRTIEEKSLYI